MERHVANLGFCSKCFSPFAKDESGALVFVTAPKDAGPIAVRSDPCSQCGCTIFLSNFWQDDGGHLFDRETGGTCIHCYVNNGGKIEFENG